MSHGVQSVVEAAGEKLLVDLYVKSKGDEFGVTRGQFEALLGEIRAKYLPADAAPAAVREFCEGLRLEELVLARACAAGNEHAWEVFLTQYREKLYDIAGYIARESSSARELADSLYADLYGTSTRDGQRVSKLASYTGRGSLEGWLRTVLAQEYVNRYRRQRRLVSLDGEAEEGAQFASADPEPSVAVDPRVESAIDEALVALRPEDQFVLAAYYLDQQTLAEIARMLGVHESTISRKLDKIAKSLRKQILSILTRRGMSRRQAMEALEIDIRDIQLNIRQRLSQESATQPFPDKGAKAGASDGPG